jgi:hypothetical protein
MPALVGWKPALPGGRSWKRCSTVERKLPAGISFLFGFQEDGC